MKKQLFILIVTVSLLISCRHQRNSGRLNLLPELEKSWAIQLINWYRDWTVPSTKKVLNPLKIPKKFEPRRNNLLIEPNLNFTTPKLKKVK